MRNHAEIERMVRKRKNNIQWWVRVEEEGKEEEDWGGNSPPYPGWGGTHDVGLRSKG